MNDEQKYSYQQRIILIISAIASIWLTLIFYPGVLYSDSFARWDLALKTLHSCGGINKFTILPSLWMALTYFLTQNFAAFSVLQSFLFFYSSLRLIAIMGNFKTKWIWMPLILFISFPLFQAYSVYHESSIGTVIGINFLLIVSSCARKRFQEINAAKLSYCFLVYLLIFSTIFGFRQNTIIILPAVIFIVLKTSSSKKILITQALALVISLIFVYSLPDLFLKFKDIQKGQETNIAMAWETAEIIHRTHDPKYEHCLDYLGNSPNATMNSLPNIEEDIWLSLFNSNALSIFKVQIPEVSQHIQSDYFRIISDHPKAFLENKIYNSVRMLGFYKPLAFYEFDENRWNSLPSYGCRLTELRHKGFKRVWKLMRRLAIIRTPYLMFILGILMVYAGKRYLKENVRYLNTTLGLALLYYLGFLLVTERFEFRYFFPSFYLISVILIVLLTKTFESQSRYFKFTKENSNV